MTQPPEFPPPASDPNGSPTPPPPPPPPPAYGQPSAYPGYPTPSDPPYGQQSYYGQGQPPKSGTNGFAIAGLIFGILGGCLGIVFSIIALVQINKSGQKGKGLAIAGLVISGLWIVLLALGVIGTLLGDAERDDSGAITDKGDVQTVDLRVGDCVNGIKAETTMVSVEGVPCAQPHEGEVYAIIKLDDKDFPGNAALSKRAERQCPARMEAEHPKAWNDKSIGVFYLQPTTDSWKIGDHTITCLATSETRRTGSIDD